MWSNDGAVEQPQHNGAQGVPVTTMAPAVAAPYQHGSAAVALAPPPPAPMAVPDGAFDVPATLGERIELCRFLAEANLLPQALRKQPANVLLIMHKALALNIPLSVALEHLHVIDGKVGHSAELLRGMIARAGHVLRWLEITDKTATGELVLRHDPRNPRRETFTLADAQRMKLTGKDNWTKDPSSMLVARVTTRLVSRHCPEIAVALGNLSAIDYLDGEVTEQAPVTVMAETVDAQTLAQELRDDAAKATTAEELRALGARAREADLLETVVDDEGTTLQSVMLRRIDEIAKARRSRSAEATSE